MIGPFQVLLTFMVVGALVLAFRPSLLAKILNRIKHLSKKDSE